jgi:hypothetical protein
MKYCIFIYIILISLKGAAQKWEIPIYIEKFGYLGLNDDMKLGDTVIIKHSAILYFRFVFTDKRGKSYCEIYKHNQLSERGYFENSLDTLKKYSYRKGVVPSFDKIYLFRYFQPLKHGIWEEFQKGKCYRKRVFEMGIEIVSGHCSDI